ncbi:homoprotocatechuate degradation operon regulator HpaR [Ruegeria sp.]|uniref:homoprotocatechuate degradation operon regulator HpaR n=1 Tax=Ruegeria sp. TaxID=1879320 RepID=UPI003C7C30D6
MTDEFPLMSRSLPIALLRGREKVMGPIRAILADAGVTEQQWRVLRVLQEKGAQEPTQIADQACLLLPSLTRILRKLEEKDLIARRADTEDRRRQIVEITDKGLQIIADNLTASLQQAEAIRKKMGAERHEMLLDLLGELHELDT